MDFHSLTRKDLQSLCKLNKIPANKTNVAMADALQSLDLVEGIEKFINVSQSETVELDESKENVEVSSPKVPATRCRTTRPKVKTTESEILQPTGIRTTRRTARKVNEEVIESKKDVLETPALSSTRRKALATSSCRNVNSQLNNCEPEEKAGVTKSRRKVAAPSNTVKKESTVKKAYGTRRSTRQTEKKSVEPSVRKDEMNVASDEVLMVEVPESTLNAANPNAEVEDICNALKELEVVEAVHISEEKEDSGEVDKLNPKSDEMSNHDEEGGLEVELNNVKPETDDVSNQCESEDEEKHESEINVLEEHPDSIVDDNSHAESGEEKEDSGEVDKLNSKSDKVSNQHEEGDLEIELNNVKPETDGISNPCESGDLEEEKLESEVKVLEEHPDCIPDDNSQIESGLPNAEVEDICNALEELEVVEAVHISEEKEDSGEVDKLNPKSDEISNQHAEGDLEVEVNNVKPETDGVSNPCESGDLEEEKHESEVKAFEVHLDRIVDDNSHTESGEDKEDSDEVDKLNPKSDEISNQHEDGILEMVLNKVEPETDGISNPCESGDLAEEKLESEVEVLEEHPDCILDDNSQIESGDCIDVDTIPDNNEKSNGPPELEEEGVSEVNNGVAGGDCIKVDVITDNIENSNVQLELGEEAVSQMDNGSSSMDSDMILDKIENSNEFLNSENKNDCSPVDESTNDMKEVSEIMVDETLDVIPTIDSLSPIIEEVEVVQPEVLTENGDALKGSTIEEKKQSSPIASTLFDLIGHPTHVTPIRKSSSKNDMVKTPAFSSTSRKAPATSSRQNVSSQINDREEEAKEGQKLECTHATVASTTMKKDINLEEAFSSGRSSRLTEKKFSESRVEKESEKSVKIDLMMDELNVTSEEGDPDAKMEYVCEYEDLQEEDMFCAVTEMNQVPVNNGSSTMVNDMILDDTETSKDSLNSDNVNNFNPHEEESEENVDETLDVISNIDPFKPDFSTKNSEADFVEETNQSSHNQPSILIDVTGVPTPMKKVCSYVSDDKENKKEKEKDMSLQDKSLRQLRKQLKALTLKNKANSNDTKEQEATTRPALQALCENQLVGGETKN